MEKEDLKEALMDLNDRLLHIENKFNIDNTDNWRIWQKIRYEDSEW